MNPPLMAADLPALLDTLRERGALAVKLVLRPSGAVLSFECRLGPPPGSHVAKPTPRRRDDDFVPPPAPAGLGYT